VRKPLLYGLALALTLVCLTVFVLYIPVNKPQRPSDQHVDHLVELPCDIANQVCRINLGALQFRVSLSPEGLPALEPLTFRVRAESSLISEFEAGALWFDGKEMDMGLHWGQLQVTPDQNELRFKAMVPVCTIDREMVWRLNFQFEYESQRYRFVFDAHPRHT